MFKKKGKQDTIHHTNIKRGITNHFARTLKILQQRHLQSDSDEFIYSDDYSNNLCSALEAVFLHGLKDSVVTQMSSYVGLAANQEQGQYINFWGLCAKFTHKDVVTQLRSLAQINTDIGLCRAWIRLALNDGLMESYLHSMIVDHKPLVYYYHSYSYLRDHEQPGILKNFLTGLMSLSFKLSFNSSVLNAWSNTSLQLSGLLDGQHVPTPTLTKDDTGPPSFTGSLGASNQNEKRDEPIVVNKSTKRNSRSGSMVQDGSPKPMFSTIHDVEEMRRINLANVMSSQNFVPSDGSTSSHISCPDPGNNTTVGSRRSSREMWEKGGCTEGVLISPALYPRADSDVITSEKLKKIMARDSDVQSVESLTVSESSCVVPVDDDRRDSKSSVIVEDSSPFFELELAQSPRRPRSRRVTDDDWKTISPRSATDVSIHSSNSLSLSNSPKPSDFALEGLVQDVAPKGIGDTCSDIKRSSKDHVVVARKMTNPRGVEEICATLPPLKLDPLEQDAILKKVLGEIDEQADIERQKREEQRNAMCGSYGFANLTVAENRQELPLHKGRERDSGISLTVHNSRNDERGLVGSDVTSSQSKESFGVVDSIDDAIGKNASVLLDSHASQNTSENSQKMEPSLKGEEHKVENSAVWLDENEEAACVPEDDNSVYTSGNYGNSLSGMMGWSSEIDTGEKKADDKKLRERTRGESFTSMLKTYAGQNSLISTTLDQVIQTFYGTENDENNSPPSISEENEHNLAERQDSCLEDFEILSPTPESFPTIHDMDSSRSIFLFRIPREHGLSHQNFICRGCSRPIGIIYGQPRLCEFDGGLYCYECHENNEICIPSYIVFNWDFSKKKVCTTNLKFLQALEDQALFDLDELNPKLETHIPELATLKELRHQLCFLKSYMFNCTQKVAESLRQKVWPREHLYERSSVYSVNDLHQVQSGVLMRLIKDLVKFSSKHVYQCSLCSQKGFLCEICRNPQVIYPFELETTIRCATCKSVYHKTCMTETLPCPKCKRWGKTNQASQGKIDDDHPEDYGMSPTF